MASNEFSHPAFEPIRPWVARSDPRASGRLDLHLLNRYAAARALRTEDGLDVRFVDAREVERKCNLRPQPPAYETTIRETGMVPTRIEGGGMLHDWFNALAWLAFPRIKARINRLHSDAIADGAAGPQRGALRDAATLFDESGAIFAFGDAAFDAALRASDWQALFVERRERFAREARVAVVGHAIFHKLLSPYKSLCAHAWIAPPADSFDALDAAVAAQLQPDSLRNEALHPLPLSGIPGWCAHNADPFWYDDPKVFRGRG